MSNWSDGYVTEVGYTHGYYAELAPSRLAFACLTKGVGAPGLGVEPFRLLELGCGQGLSANIIAAANQHMDYTAVDFNPAHIAGASALARDAGTPNLHLREASFAEIAADELVRPIRCDHPAWHLHMGVGREPRAHHPHRPR